MKILIAGLAKTGTTGLLYLISSSLGRPVKQLFEPAACPAELADSADDVLAKVLIGDKLDIASFAGFDKKVTIVRDPRDRMVSALLYSQYHADYLFEDARVDLVRSCLLRKEAQPASVSLAEILRVTAAASGRGGNDQRAVQRSLKWLEIFDDYVAGTPEALLYRYEDFVEERYEPLQQHLGFPITGSAQVPAMFARVERTKDHGDWRHWFTAEDVATFRPLLSDWLRRYGYDADDWRLNEDQRIDPSHGSGYFMRLVEEVRAKAEGGGAHTPRPRVPAQRRAPADRSAAKPLPPAAAAPAPRGAGRVRHNLGKIVRADTAAVVGWAIGAQPTEPITVALRINGREVAQALADRPRPGLIERGIHPTGRCGFVFKIARSAPLKVGDEVAVEPVGGGFALTNSPSTIVPALDG